MNRNALQQLICAIVLCLCFTGANAALREKTNGGVIEITQTKEIVKSGQRTITESRFDGLIYAAAQANLLDPLLVKSIIKVESDFNPNAVSKVKARGLMQLMKQTADMYKVKNPFDPAENINAGCRHFATLMDQFGNDVILALAAYHAGSSRVRKAGGVPAIKATVDYVNAVMSYYNPTDYDVIYASVRKLYMRQNGETLEIHD